jgi:uncharacterized protein (TIGR03437 family)
MRLLLALILSAPLFAQATFDRAVVASIPAPTAIAFTPGGRMLATSQSGALRIVENDILLPVPALTIPASRICTNSERGLLGVAVDPDFSSNGFVYLYYTFRPAGSNCGSRANPTPLNRVSRFTMTGNTVDPASEKPLIDNIPSWNGNHNGGDLHFGNDGYLYISVGDSGCDPYGNGCAGANDAARDVHTLLGKILRIDRDGGIPPNNPFTGPGTQRCHLANAPAGIRCQETYAWGLRNPFRIAFDRNDPDINRFFILDVGQDVREEINLGAPGADYGWNSREGACVNGSRTNCPPPPAGVTDPIFAYPHGVTVPGTGSSGCNSISGGAFVPAGAFTPEYDGAFVYADYVCGKLFVLSPQPGGAWRARDFTADTPGSAVHLAFGPFGRNRQALYYTTYSNGGQIRRISLPGEGPNAPTVTLSATPTSGPLPLTVNFTAQGTAANPGDVLNYSFSFGDQTQRAASTSNTARHTYERAGVYDATVRAANSQGVLSQPATVRIFAGNRAPVPAIQAPATFAVGQRLTLTGSAIDAEDGPLPASALTWTVILHHDEHTHPFLGPIAGGELTFAGPAPESLEAAATSYLEVRLQARDAAGEVTTIVRELRPQLVDLTFESEPAGLSVAANGVAYRTPRKAVSWAGYAMELSTAQEQDLEDNRYGFVAWSNGGERSQSFTTPGQAATLRARFERIGPAGNATAVNGASFSAGVVAPSSLATIQGQGFSSSIAVAGEGPWPVQLAGVRILVEDSAGVTHRAPIYFVTPDAANFELPAETKSGRATVRVRRLADDGDVALAYTLIEAVAPGVFTLSGDGKGLARGAVRDGDAVNQLNEMDSVPAGASLLLLTTGLRNAETIAATIGGIEAEVLGVTRHGFPGLDEVEIRIPIDLAGRGAVTIQMTADGKSANPATVNVR